MGRGTDRRDRRNRGELGTVTDSSRASESPFGVASPAAVSASLARIHSRGYFALRSGLRSPAKRGPLCHTRVHFCGARHRHSGGYFALRSGLRSPAKQGPRCHTTRAAVPHRGAAMDKTVRPW